MTNPAPKFDPGAGALPPNNRRLGLEEPARRLSTMREAAIALAEHGITFEQIRRWVYRGVGRHKLTTHHVPGRADATLVDLGEVLGFHRRLQQRRIHAPRRSHPNQSSFHIREDRARGFRDLAQAYARKLGVPHVTIPDAVWMAVQQELRRIGGPTR